jgi:hypothetical protein
MIMFRRLGAGTSRHLPELVDALVSRGARECAPGQPAAISIVAADTIEQAWDAMDPLSRAERFRCVVLGIWEQGGITERLESFAEAFTPIGILNMDPDPGWDPWMFYGDYQLGMARYNGLKYPPASYTMWMVENRHPHPAGLLIEIASDQELLARALAQKPR